MDGINICGMPTHDQWPEILSVRLRALRAKRAALLAEIRAQLGG
jgi:hypothetical protein